MVDAEKTQKAQINYLPAWATEPRDTTTRIGMIESMPGPVVCNVFPSIDIIVSYSSAPFREIGTPDDSSP